METTLPGKRARGSEAGRSRAWRVARALAVPLLLAMASPALGDEFVVITHPGHGSGGLTASQVSRLFLKKETRWPDGTLVHPMVLAEPRVYEDFCRRIHGKPASALHAYWTQMIFSGREVPPLERRRESEVLEYVRTTPGAIAFVATGTATPGVRVVTIRK